ncbi:MAG: hypothetical protein ACTSPY_18380 [Candidatus Helarchaeota archaeon]
MSKEEKICVLVLMKLINYISSQIATFDNDFKSKLTGLDEIVEWKVGDDIKYYTIIKDGNINGSDETPGSPTLSFIIDNAESALKVLSGKVDFDEALNMIKITGKASLAQKLNFILEKVNEYIGDLTG